MKLVDRLVIVVVGLALAVALWHIGDGLGHSGRIVTEIGKQINYSNLP